MSAPQQILFVSAHPPGRVPSQRFRFEQYVDFLAKHGFETTFSPIFRQDDYQLVYGSGNTGRKALIFSRGLLARLWESLTARSYDIVFVQREAIQLGTTFFERAMARTRARLVFDFDDAVWLPDSSSANRRMAWVKRPQKVDALIAISDLVFAGNDYLANHARRLNANVEVIPTTIDTDQYVCAGGRASGPVCIGWTGSPTTSKHFELALPALRLISERFGDRVRFKVIGDPAYRCTDLAIEGQPWRAETEVEDIAEIDIGLMPLPDDPWAQGKCGLKGLQYMALEKPAIMSPVGVNREIIEHGENGFLASTVDEWVDAIAALIESPQARQRLGQAARRTVVERYSVESQKGRYLQHLSKLVGER